MITKHLKKFIDELPPNAKILDVGCGKGKTMRFILSERDDLIIFGVDIKNQLEEDISKKTEFFKESAEQLDKIFDENSFDAVICQHVIEHLLYPYDLIIGIKYVLRNKGKLFLETPNWTRLFVPFLSIYFWNDPSHIRPFSKTTIKRLSKESGFKILVLKTISTAKFFKDLLIAILENEK